jgi:tRNA modification GTPase
MGADMAELNEGPPHWLIQNKIDLLHSPLAQSGVKKNEHNFIFSLSATEGEGLEEVIAALAKFATGFFAGGENAVVTRARHRETLEQTAAALDRAVAEAAGASPREELIAEELRQASSALGRLTGRVDVEDVLDKIFRDFCIGK